MKNSKTILLTAVITAILFSAVIFSCTKSSNNNTADPCSGVTCQNGGTCSNGTCSCPTGYTGTLCQTPATTTITYTNDTYTPISITVNSSTQTIAVGGNVAYTGTYKSTISITASTSGKTSGGAVIGTVRNWSGTDTFPSSGTLNKNLGVSSNVFFLKIQNNDPTYDVQGLYVNYGTSSQTFDNDFNIPNNGLVYPVGYYEAINSNEIYMLSYPTGTSWSAYPTFTFTANQEKIITVP